MAHWFFPHKRQPGAQSARQRWERLRLGSPEKPAPPPVEAAALEMEGPYPFIWAGLAIAPRLEKPGTYALGYVRDGGFRPGYLGWADGDLHVELRRRLSTHADYSHFMFSYAPDSQAAREKHRRQYEQLRHYLEKKVSPIPESTPNRGNGSSGSR
jgi:hypothetical protein